ncbi:putative leucine-rich repeat receptor-like serine/threonine-protein kinase At2g19230 isoform X4 [Nymphaea colorata]|nr:putative leucine-rich repeat receptor-like serine/threonine-protein kinase At2g19230 isoform X4 [Nymphaea colorata]
MMGRRGLFFLLRSAALFFLVGAQTGFISIDCGLTESPSYVDENDNLTYVSDDGFVDTGVNRQVDPELKETNKRYQTVRAFPNYTRNCYYFPATIGARYFIRVAFMYGNYDGLNTPPSFDLYLGVDLWDNIKLDNVTHQYRSEIIVQAEASYTHLCLVETGGGTPFISYLKLRPLTDDVYAPANSSALVALTTFRRVNLGATGYVRYPDDRFDRIWTPDYDSYGTPYNTSEKIVESERSPFFALPSVVMQTAVYQLGGINISWLGGADRSFYVFLEFADILPTLSGTQRQMQVLENGQYWGEVNVSNLSPSILYSTSPSSAPQFTFSIQSANDSDEGAVLNSFEVYEVLTLSGSTTDAGDVTAITAIKEYYQLKRNWIGDPCLPDNSPWDGLTCGNDSRPWIVTLDLSNGGLSGEIVDHISKLTELKTLNLSRNNLQGPVPPFLQEMPNLINIDLSSNSLSGSIPNGLQEKVKNGEVMLRIDNNPLICQQDGCNQQESSNSSSSSSATAGSKGSNSATGLKNSYTVTAISVAIYLLLASCLSS